MALRLRGPRLRSDWSPRRSAHRQPIRAAHLWPACACSHRPGGSAPPRRQVRRLRLRLSAWPRRAYAPTGRTSAYATPSSAVLRRRTDECDSRACHSRLRRAAPLRRGVGEVRRLRVGALNMRPPAALSCACASTCRAAEHATASRAAPRISTHQSERRICSAQLGRPARRRPPVAEMNMPLPGFPFSASPPTRRRAAHATARQAGLRMRAYWWDGFACDRRICCTEHERTQVRQPLMRPIDSPCCASPPTSRRDEHAPTGNPVLSMSAHE